jgi:hypothetical protein
MDKIIALHSEDQMAFINILCEFHADLLDYMLEQLSLLSFPLRSMGERGCGKSFYIEVITNCIWCRSFYISYISRVLFSIYEALLLYVTTV